MFWERAPHPGNGAKKALPTIIALSLHSLFYCFLTGVPSQKRRMPRPFLASPRAPLA